MRTYNSGQIFFDSASGLLENENSKVDNGVDAAKLLKQHKSHGQQQWLKNGSLQQLSRLNLLRIGSSTQVRFQAIEFAVDISMTSYGEKYGNAN